MTNRKASAAYSGILIIMVLLTFEGCLVFIPTSQLVSLKMVSLVLSAGATQSKHETDDDPNFAGRVEDDTTCHSIAVEYRPLEPLGIQLGYTKLGELRYKGDYSGVSDYGRKKNSGFKAAVMGYVPIFEYLEAFGKVGVFRWDSKEREVYNGSAIRYHDEGTGRLFGLGLQSDVVDQLTVRLEWERYLDVSHDDYNAVMLSLVWSPFPSGPSAEADIAEE